MARVDLSFDKVNTISIYKYEPFWYRILKPTDVSGISSTVSSGIPGSFLDVSTRSYADLSSATGYNGGTAADEYWTVNALDSSLSTVLRTFSNKVSINPGRFVDSSDNSRTSNLFTFNLKEPFSPFLFKSFINLQSTPIVSPTLPPGISFVQTDASSYSLTASPFPSVVLPTTNYQVIGKGTGVDVGKIVTTRFNLAVAQERILLDLSGSPIIGPMPIDSNITPSQVTARYPPYPWAGSNLRYTWPALPDGLTFATPGGTPVASGYVPSDASSSIVLQGAPTAAAARSFANAAISNSVSVTLTGTRINVAPFISASKSFSFSFARSVLFDPVTVPVLFTDISLNSTDISFGAHTYFGSNDASMTTIFSPNLRSDLSLDFSSNQQVAYLRGKPSGPSNAYYTIRAVNNLNDTRDLSVNIVSSNITISYLTPPTPVPATSYTFVTSRPLSNALPGYYTYPIQFRASNNANLPMTYTASSLPIGVTLSNIGNDTVQLVGTPGVAFAPATVDISATVTGSTQSVSRQINITAINDVYTFNNPGSLSFIQNRVITPFQISATTLSERNVIQYTSLDIPPNLGITNRGIVSGTDISSASGSFNVSASTGYTQGVNNFPFTVTPDSFLLFVSDTTYLLDNPGYFTYKIQEGSAVSIPIRGISFSGIPVDRFSITGVDMPKCPFVIDSTTGVLTAKTGVYVVPDAGTLTYNIEGWSSTTPTTLTPAGQLGVIIDTGIGDTFSIVQFSATLAGGPTFTSPDVTTYLLYQYVPITPIVLAATGATPIRMYVAVGDLPIGLTFDPATQTISGKPAFVGYDEVLVYAQDSASRYTSILLKFTTIVPSVVRKQTGAGAYTSLVRQYTNVNAAQNARDNRALPSGERSLGEFMSPQPPDVVTAVPPCLE